MRHVDQGQGRDLRPSRDRTAIDPPDPDDPHYPHSNGAQTAAVRCYRFFLDRGESPTEDGERPHIAITVPLESGDFETMAISPSRRVRSASCSATRNSKGSTSVQPSTGPHANSDEPSSSETKAAADIPAATEPTAKCTTSSPSPTARPSSRTSSSCATTTTTCSTNPDGPRPSTAPPSPSPTPTAEASAAPEHAG